MYRIKHSLYNPRILFFVIFMSFKTELLLHSRAKGRWLITLLFFILVCSLFPLSGMGKTVLPIIGPNIIWIVALLASLLSLMGFLQHDWETGRLEQWMLSPFPLSLFMLSLLLAHWCVTGLPVVCMVPLLGLLFHMPLDGVWSLSVCLMFGTSILTIMGALVSTLTLGIHQGGALLMLCVFPLMIPVLMMGVSAVQQASIGLSWSGQLALMSALWIVLILLGPWGMAMVVKVMDD